KFFSLLGVMLIGLSILVGAGTSVYAAEKVNEVPDIETQRQQAVESLQFYLEEAGYVDTETHQYIVTDLEAIQKKAALDGSEGIAGKFILENFVQPTGKRQKRDLQKYAACVVMNSLPFGGVVWDILNRENLMQTLINALQGKNYDYAVKILLDVAKRSLTPAQFAKFNAATIAAGIAINAISCWGN
ncbi:streptococcin A-M57, partial [Enterococcus gallinarum]|uniref:streptococcin A-M57 n=1 Tax=Enterococcus gallinarum TaxID=1353 RepID=UPI00391BBEDA